MVVNIYEMAPNLPLTVDSDVITIIYEIYTISFQPNHEYFYDRKV